MISIYHLAPCVAQVVYQTQCLWGEGERGRERGVGKTGRPCNASMMM